MSQMIQEDAVVLVRDGTTIAVRVYRPGDSESHPALLAASPYRFDNNVVSASPQFLWRETGPIAFYVANGYAFVHMDVRGSGRSGGTFGFLDRHDQHDLCDVVAWIGQQPWSGGGVGGIGQSYYCMLQWFMAAAAPPGLKCIAAHDGLCDAYRAGTYHGGIPCDFFPGYWWYQNRFINRFPAEGPSREQTDDLAAMIAAHPTYDEFWRERSAWETLDRITLPLYSSGVWSKMQLHTRGNIDGFARARGPKKLRMSGAPNAWAAAAEYASVEFHERVLLPFYDHYLKGKQTNYLTRPAVEYAVRGANVTRSATSWPPEGVRYEAWTLDAGGSGSVTSLNDGSLFAPGAGEPCGAAATSYSYPNPGWVSGVVGFGPTGPAGGFDPARRVLTFTSPVLEHDVEIAGPVALTLYASSSRNDTDFFVKLCDQFPQAADDRANGINPFAEVVTRGWLRASHRELDTLHSTDHAPYHTHRDPQPLIPGTVYRFDISLEPMAYRFARGHRVRLEIVNGDSPVTEALWPHFYRPDKIGTDTIYHDAGRLSHLVLPVLQAE